VEDHNVIDEAIREEAEVSIIRNICDIKGCHLPSNRAIQYFLFLSESCIDRTMPKSAI
jgi:hypothetical protein